MDPFSTPSSSLLWDLRVRSEERRVAVTPNTAGGYANFQLKKYDMKAKGARGYTFFQKTRNKATTLEKSNIISYTTTPTPAFLTETRALAEKKLREGVLNGSIPSAAYDTA